MQDSFALLITQLILVHELSINLINVINETHYIIYTHITIRTETALNSNVFTKLNVFTVNLQVCILAFMIFT